MFPDTVSNESDRQPAPLLREERLTTALATALLVLHGGLAWLTRMPGIETRQDDALYVLLARSLRDGGYREIFRIDAPVHSMYPPAYPATLAIWGWPVGDAYDALVLLSVVASVVALALTFVATRRVFSTRIALLTLAVLAVNPALIQYAGSISSESMYTALAAATLWALATPSPSRGRVWLAGAAAILAGLTRSIGATLVLALAVLWLLRREWRTVAWFTAASAILVGGWLLWTALAPEQFVGKSYVADATLIGEASERPLIVVLIERAVRHAAFYLAIGVPWILPLPTIAGTPVDNVLTAGAAAVGLLAGTFVLLRRWRAAGIYLVTFATLLLAWPWQHDRFAVPLLPVIVPAIIVGLEALLRPWAARWRIAASAAMAVLILSAATSRTTADATATIGCERADMPPASCLTRDQISYFDALRYIQRATALDAVFLTAKPEPMFLYTGRRSVPFLAAVKQPKENFVPHLRSLGVAYILLGSLQGNEPGRLSLTMLDHCRALELVQFFPERTYLFRLRGMAEAADGGAACAAMEDYRKANRNRRFGVDP